MSGENNQMPIEIDSNDDDVPRDSESAEPNGHKLEFASNSVSAAGSEKQVSDVFLHIVPSADKKHFICKLCHDKKIVQKWTNKSTTNFRRFLEQKHADVYTIAKRYYMVVTIHYIDSNWDMRHCIIVFIRVLYPHTGERLAVHLIKAVKEMDPSLLPVKEGLKRSSHMDVAIGTFRDLFKKINDSPKLMEALKSVASTLKLEKLALPQLDVETSFTGFTIAPTDTLIKHIAEESWSALKDFASFLKPFKDVTVLLSASEYPTLGMAIPVFHMCTQHAKAAIAASTGFRSTRTIEFAKHVVAKLAEYDGKVRNNVTRIATALDPRTKAFMNGIGIRQAEIELELVAAWDDHYEPLYNREFASDARASGSMHQDKTATTSTMSSLLQLLQAPQCNHL
ncbi:hypothetical protein AXG93_1474s1120 [Marchantia polymorpha subsp. ruderalis]|uniref:hAT-like transposase RNase-H fold domain-containing protein n=1 Tax=Marchantia polymorpha subsp. ruderalis TaxID=1480154 RepID=A0A176WD75_MARPO|nr:hypothetical protein AXG93_1474s1120 [Marchantia polymorpha subsp. ruderalis]